MSQNGLKLNYAESTQFSQLSVNQANHLTASTQLIYNIDLVSNVTNIWVIFDDQLVQNESARLISGARHDDRIAPVLVTVHSYQFRRGLRFVWVLNSTDVTWHRPAWCVCELCKKHCRDIVTLRLTMKSPYTSEGDGGGGFCPGAAAVSVMWTTESTQSQTVGAEATTT